MATIAEQVSQEFLRVQNNRNTIRAKLVELNLAASTATLDALATAISEIINRGTVNALVKEGETYTIEPGYYAGGSVGGTAGGGNYSLQDKTSTPTKKAQTITSDSGYYGLSSVVVNAIPENYQDVSDVTATAPDVLLGKVIVLADGTVKAGTMPNNGAVTKALDASTVKYTIAAGYHSGTGTVSITLEEKSVTPTKAAQTITPSTGKVLSKVTVAAIPDKYQDVSPVTATAAHVLDGDIFVDATGAQVEGTMVDNGAVSKTLDTTTTSYTVPAGHHNGSGKVSIVTETKSATPTKAAQTIKPTSGKVLSQVSVAAIPAEYITTTDATAAAGEILDGETAYVNGVKVEGSMPNNGATALTFDPLTQSSVAIPAGYTSGGNVTLTEDLLNALKAI